MIEFELVRNNNLNLEKYRNWFDFLWAMSEKETKARYKNAVLGFAWMALNPVLQMIIIGLVFQFFVSFSSIENYYSFLFIGLLVWNFFSSSLNQVSPIFVQQRFLLQKANFSREVLPLSVILSNLFHLIISFVLLTVFIVFKGDFLFIKELLLFVLAILWLLFFTSGLGLLVSSLNVKYRDINFIMQASLPIGFYLTPIVYADTMLPEKFRWLLFLNPLSSIVTVLRTVFLHRAGTENSYILLSLLVTVVVFVFGVVVFKKHSKSFSDYV